MTQTTAPATPAAVHVHVSDGTSQSQRILPALQAGYFHVEELRFEQLLALAHDYARVVTFYNLDDRADGVWDQVYSASELIVIATILSIDLKQMESGFDRRLRAGGGDVQAMLRDAGKHPSRLAQADNVSPLSLARLLDHWLTQLAAPQSSAGEELRTLIESVVTGLRKELHAIRRLVRGAGAEDAIEPLFSDSFALLGLQTSAPGEREQAEALYAADELEASLRSIFSCFVQAVAIVQDGARRLLPASMRSRKHDPAVSLLVTFVRLYQKLQHKINRFTQNHLDFYYEQILRTGPRGPVPDRVHLVMRLNAANIEVTIPQGTEFLAGLDENKHDIVYAADHDTVLNDAVVSRLLTLHFPGDGADAPATASGVDASGPAAARACWADEIPARPDGEAQDRDTMQPYALLGAPRDGKRPVTVEHARIGFALASNVLLMREGRRRVRVSLQYETRGDDTSLEDEIRRIAMRHADGGRSDTRRGAMPRSAAGPASETTAPSAADQKDAFFKTFGAMFALGLTTDAGWLEIADYRPSCKLVDSAVKPNCLVIEFNLPPDSPAIVPYRAGLHGEDYDTALPVLRFTLRPNEYQYPYGVLKRLLLKDARIDVYVHGCRELLLHNQIGQLTPLAPFAPFGPLPALGSYLVVGHAETRSKQLTRFDIDVEWGGLPIGTDFAGWYRGYAHAPATADFLASVSVLADGRWLPPAPVPVRLFSAARAAGRVSGIAACQTLSADAVIPYYKAQDNQQAAADFVYTPATKSGLFKFTLSGPAGGFGHQEYPVLLAQTLTYNSRVKSEHLARPIPNAPYTPQIDSISLNYAAFAVISRDDANERTPARFRERLLHLHPFGWETISRSSGPRIYQLPQFDAPGTLYIGLNASAMRQSLTLYFHLHRDSLPMPSALEPGLQWAYLSDNHWRPLPPNQIVADSTEGFMTSGIVTLRLPDDLARGNTVMPPDLYWLKISAQRGLENFCRVYSVYAQAVQASWRRGDHAASRLPVVLPAGSISRARKSIPGLGRIEQVCRSFGGTSAEDAGQWRTRVSERLRHKNRALLPVDYESLILEQFPEIYKVKCFANTRSDYPGRACPGHILIVPVPYLAPDGQLHQKPRLSGQVIHEVRQFVQRVAPPFARIAVENPVYEEIQVRCAVTLKAGLRGGHFSNLLNDALCDFLSPWHPLGYTAHFGWHIRQHDLESFIQDLDYVDQVSDFSLLRVASDSSAQFSLDDSARRQADGSRNRDLAPKLPWSVAVPIKRHAIQTADRFNLVEPEITGVQELEVGCTFIISARE